MVHVMRLNVSHFDTLCNIAALQFAQNKVITMCLLSGKVPNNRSAEHYLFGLLRSPKRIKRAAAQVAIGY